MILAHGIGGVRDLPVPVWLFYYGAGIVLGASFVALAVLWRRPLLERLGSGRPLPERLQRIILSPALRVLLAACSLGLLVLIWLAALIGKDSATTNFAPTFVYVVFWLGLVPLSVLFGNVWSVLNPWRAAADGAAWISTHLGGEYVPPFEYPSRLGRFPAAILLLAFATLELCYIDPSSPRVLALAIFVYSWITWTGMAAFGRAAWLDGGEAFTSYFGLLSRCSPFVRRGDRIALRPPLTGLGPVLRAPGTVAFVAVMLGSVAFDGFSRASIWQKRYYNVQIDFIDRPSLADLIGMLMNLGGLLGMVLLVYLAFTVAVRAAGSIGREEERLEPLSNAFVSSLVPIALVYAVAHYFSLFVLQGQVAIKLASDPFGWGWNLLGTSGFQPDFGVLTPKMIWYAQVGALLTGHMAGLAVAHDRAVSLFRSARLAVATQYPMLALMVAYTVGGMWILHQG